MASPPPRSPRNRLGGCVWLLFVLGESEPPRSDWLRLRLRRPASLSLTEPMSALARELGIPGCCVFRVSNCLTHTASVSASWLLTRSRNAPMLTSGGAGSSIISSSIEWVVSSVVLFPAMAKPSSFVEVGYSGFVGQVCEPRHSQSSSPWRSSSLCAVAMLVCPPKTRNWSSKWCSTSRVSSFSAVQRLSG
jgi:hypothetical protein